MYSVARRAEEQGQRQRFRCCSAWSTQQHDISLSDPTSSNSTTHWLELATTWRSKGWVETVSPTREDASPPRIEVRAACHSSRDTMYTQREGQRYGIRSVRLCMQFVGVLSSRQRELLSRRSPSVVGPWAATRLRIVRPPASTQWARVGRILLQCARERQRTRNGLTGRGGYYSAVLRLATLCVERG